MNQIYTGDPVDLAVKANIILSKFRDLKYINDVAHIVLWHNVVAKGDVIKDLWPVMVPLFDEPGLQHCKAEVVYYQNDGAWSSVITDLSSATGIQIEMITDSARLGIEKETEQNKKDFFTPTQL